MKRLPWIRHTTPFLLPASYLLAVHSGNAVLLLAAALLLFVATPLLDAILPHDKGVPTDPHPITDALPAVYVVAHAVCLYATAELISRDALDWISAVAAMASLGAAGGVLICASHELLHSAGPWRRQVGRAGMAMVGYGHFEIGHLHGHHRNACTAEDYSTAYRGESLYRYFARAIPGCFQFARNEARRRRWRWPGRHPASPIISLTISLILALVGTFATGAMFFVVFLGQAAVAVALLEATSYVEHYGLRRKLRGAGREPFGAQHSWDSDHAMSNALLFRLPRHADHHLHSTRRFSRLESHAEARPLPAGYPTMIMLAMLPAVWRRVMHPLLDGQGTSTTECKETESRCVSTPAFDAPRRLGYVHGSINAMPRIG